MNPYRIGKVVDKDGLDIRVEADHSPSLTGGWIPPMFRDPAVEGIGANYRPPIGSRVLLVVDGDAARWVACLPDGHATRQLWVDPGIGPTVLLMDFWHKALEAMERRSKANGSDLQAELEQVLAALDGEMPTTELVEAREYLVVQVAWSTYGANERGAAAVDQLVGGGR